MTNKNAVIKIEQMILGRKIPIIFYSQSRINDVHLHIDKIEKENEQKKDDDKSKKNPQHFIDQRFIVNKYSGEVSRSMNNEWQGSAFYQGRKIEIFAAYGFTRDSLTITKSGNTIEEIVRHELDHMIQYMLPVYYTSKIQYPVEQQTSFNQAFGPYLMQLTEEIMDKVEEVEMGLLENLFKEGWEV